MPSKLYHREIDTHCTTKVFVSEFQTDNYHETDEDKSAAIDM